MRLTSPTDDLQSRAFAALDQRLLRQSSRPVAVAVSGGGDSLALLLIASRWAATNGRRLLALNVDHGLQPESPAWAAACASRAERLGVAFRPLAWTGPKPHTGLPAAARAARHILLAEAAREAGCRVLLMGHTQDDVLEAARMRAAGSSTPAPRQWSPSPAWPQGRDLFLLRPLLGMRRAAIRAWLTDQGEAWIDDPANQDLRYARPRARQSADIPPLHPSTDGMTSRALAKGVEPLAGGFIIERGALCRAAFTDAQRLVAMAALSAAGTARPPLRDRTRGLTSRLIGAEVFTASLAGARITAEARRVTIFREAGEARRGGMAPLDLIPGEPAVWDGRFEITADRSLRIIALQGHARRLEASQSRALAALPAAARASLPWTEDGSPMLGPIAGLRCAPLAQNRFLAACGVLDREPV